MGVIMDKCGSLEDHLNSLLTSKNYVTLFKGYKALANGLKTMHDNGLFHNDFKIENALLKNDTPVVMDFGLAMKRDQLKEHDHIQIDNKQVGGTYYDPDCVRYRAGQLTADQLDGTKIDVWAFGCALLRQMDPGFLQSFGGYYVDCDNNNTSSNTFTAESFSSIFEFKRDQQALFEVLQNFKILNQDGTFKRNPYTLRYNFHVFQALEVNKDDANAIIAFLKQQHQNLVFAFVTQARKWVTNNLLNNEAQFFQNLGDLILHCVTDKQSDRYTMDQVLNHSFFQMV